MSHIPNFFRLWLSHSIWRYQAKAILNWLDSNSVWVIADDLRNALNERLK